MTPSEFETATFRRAAQWINQMPPRAPDKNTGVYNLPSRFMQDRGGEDT